MSPSKLLESPCVTLLSLFSVLHPHSAVQRQLETGCSHLQSHRKCLRGADRQRGDGSQFCRAQGLPAVPRGWISIFAQVRNPAAASPPACGAPPGSVLPMLLIGGPAQMASFHDPLLETNLILRSHEGPNMPQPGGPGAGPFSLNGLISQKFGCARIMGWGDWRIQGRLPDKGPEAGLTHTQETQSISPHNPGSLGVRLRARIPS